MRRRSALLSSLALLLPVGLTAVPQAGAAAAPPPGFGAQTVRDWERTAMQVVYDTDKGASPVPLGVPRLGYTSLAMYQAVTESQGRRWSSEAAAAANAAHDVLLSEYGDKPGAVSFLAGELDTTMAQLPDNKATDRGTRIGRRVAAALIAEREDDGLDRTDIVYTKPPGPGVWQPPPTGMLGAQLGFAKRLVLDHRVKVDGPDALHTRAYARDYREVKKSGGVDSTARSDWQTETSKFFNFNSATMVGSAVLDRFEEEPLKVRRTARLFATMHASMTDAIITCWRLKYRVGFWRPFQAIEQAADDGNPRTTPDDDWVELLAPTPPYSDYVSGHGCLTAPAVETVRLMLGERTPLTLVNPAYVPPGSTTPVVLERTYMRLSKIERQALNSRIWGGLHFRDAMDDAYLIGHRTARRMFAELR